MTDTLQHLRDSGYKLTGARTTVLRVLKASGGQVTSTERLDKVSTERLLTRFAYRLG